MSFMSRSEEIRAPALRIRSESPDRPLCARDEQRVLGMSIMRVNLRASPSNPYYGRY
jgi:hypothetical protein